MMKKCIFYLCINLFVLNTLQAQEVLTGLRFNPEIKKISDNFSILHQKSVSKFIYYESILIPFTEDFSNYSFYPDTGLWIDNYAFVNNSFGLNLPTLGMVTLDAVDQFGRVYQHGQKVAFPADTLTSRPIRLDSIFSPFPKGLTAADSLYFSFYYQPGGGIGQPWNRLGNAPETDDSLLLEFGYYTGDTVLAYYVNELFIADKDFAIGDTIFSSCDSTLFLVLSGENKQGDSLYVPCDSVLALESKWIRVWSSEGMTLEAFVDTFDLDTANLLFQQVMIPIVDSVYFNKGFQFRFRNYASLEYTDNNPTWASNVDFWNVDYIRLDRTRSWMDTIIDDVAFSNNPGSILAHYQSMPWSQFKNNQTNELIDDFKVKLSNLSGVVKNTSYKYIITDEENQMIDNYDGGSYNISPVFSSGFQTYQPHANPPFSSTFPSDNKDSAIFNIIHIFKEAGSGDKNPKNDTAVFQQKFYNYFAYDDGVPESGYTVLNVYSYRTSMALGFSLYKADTLRAIEIYINQVLYDLNNFQFELTVWADSSNYPGKIIYSELIEQEYSNDLYGFQRFYLNNPVPVSGKFYIGYQIETKNYLNVGFDQNNTSETIFYKTGNYWEKSFLFGTPMLRPFLGKEWTPLAIDAAEENISFQINLYPNPVNDILHLSLPEKIESKDIQMEIFTVNGQKIYSGNYRENINVSNYQSGFYVLKAYHKTTGEMLQSKFIVYH